MRPAKIEKRTSGIQHANSTHSGTCYTLLRTAWFGNNPSEKGTHFFAPYHPLRTHLQVTEISKRNQSNCFTQPRPFFSERSFVGGEVFLLCFLIRDDLTIVFQLHPLFDLLPLNGIKPFLGHSFFVTPFVLSSANRHHQTIPWAVPSFPRWPMRMLCFISNQQLYVQWPETALFQPETRAALKQLY